MMTRQTEDRCTVALAFIVGMLMAGLSVLAANNIDCVVGRADPNTYACQLNTWLHEHSEHKEGSHQKQGGG